MSENPWAMQYTTEQTYRSAEGAQMKRNFVVYARTQRQALVTAHVCFVDVCRRLGIKP